MVLGSGGVSDEMERAAKRAARAAAMDAAGMEPHDGDPLPYWKVNLQFNMNSGVSARAPAKKRCRTKLRPGGLIWSEKGSEKGSETLL